MPELTTLDEAIELLLDQWSVWMRAGSLSERTVQGRTSLVRLLAKRQAVDPARCGWESLAEFLAALPTTATRVTYQADLRAWFTWLQLTGRREDNPTDQLRRARRPRRRPRPITVEQLGQLLQSRMHHRTRVMILLGAFAGMRVSEIAATRGEFVGPTWIRVLGKGDTDEILPLHPLLAQAAMTMPSKGWWFPSNSTRPGDHHVHGNSVSTMISAAMQRAGVPAVAHQLRHTFATQTLRANGGNIRETQQLMRHANIASTAMYAANDPEKMAATIARLPTAGFGFLGAESVGL